MQLKIYGQTMQVEVDSDGTFYYINDRKLHGRTLKGLEKRLLEAFKPLGNFEVEHNSSGKKGTVVNVTNEKYEWNKKYSVKWEDGTQTIELVHSLRKRLTSAELAQLTSLRQAKEEAQEALTQANTSLVTLTNSFKVEQALKEAFRRH